MYKRLTSLSRIITRNIRAEHAMFRHYQLLSKCMGIATQHRQAAIHQTVNQRRNFSSRTSEAIGIYRAHSFGEHLRLRQQEALRTIVFQVASVDNYNDLQKHCSQFGSVNKAYAYQTRRGPNLILVEFEDKAAADEVMKTHQFIGSDYSERSRYPEFKLQQFKSPPTLNQSANIVELNTEAGKNRLPSTEMYSELQRAATVEEQIDTLFSLTSLNDLHVRLRFLALVQVEDAIRSTFPDARAYPFGSSASGFGRQISDLDFVVKNHNFKVPAMAGIMEFQTGISAMQPLSNASTPIIKYYHSLLDLEVDLSLDSLRGVYGTEILYCCGQIDSRLRPLIFSLRWWADRMEVTKPTPGGWIKNYGMNLLTIFYLQQLKNPILPPLTDIIKLEREGTPEPEANFIKDIRQLSFKTTNTDSVAELIMGFIDFYDNFDFSKHAISVERGCTVPKVDFSFVDVVDLFGTENVTTNVTKKYATTLRKAFTVSNALNFDLAGSTKTIDPWGLVAFYKKCDEARYIYKRPKSVKCN